MRSHIDRTYSVVQNLLRSADCCDFQSAARNLDSNGPFQEFSQRH